MGSLIKFTLRPKEIPANGFAPAAGGLFDGILQMADNAGAVDVRPSRLSGVRSIVDVIFSSTHRSTDVTRKLFCRVDVTEEFPFLVTKLSPYFDR